MHCNQFINFMNYAECKEVIKTMQNVQSLNHIYQLSRMEKWLLT